MVKLSKSLTHVTGFSKILALFLILAFLGVAFLAGMMFQKEAGSMMNTFSPTPTQDPR